LTQIDKLTTGHQTAVTSLQTDLQSKQTELRDLLKATQPDQTAINAKIDEISSVQAQFQKENASYQIAVRGVLTSDQQAALDAARVAGVGFGLGHGRGHGRGMGHGRR
jgi:Spy/CpxP family protein refolding chaperone